jgi:hypothetical protein
LLSDETDRILNEEVMAYSWYYPRRCLEELSVITKSAAKIRPENPQYPSPESYCYIRLLVGEDWIQLFRERLHWRVFEKTN